MNNSFNHLIKLINGDAIDFSKVDLEQLLDSAKAHRIIGIIYLALLQNKSAPSEFVQRFKISKQQNQLAALKQLQTLIQIQNLFQQNNIPMICIKGPTLSYLLYDDISVRESKDIDILIPFEKIISSHEILLQHGYELTTKDEIFKYNHINIISDDYKDLIYYQAENNVELELHWRLDLPFIFNPSFDELWQKRQPLLIQNHEFQILSNKDYCIFLCLHGSRSTWRRLQWLCDYLNAYEQFLPSETEKKAYNENVFQNGFSNHYNLAIYLAKYFFSKNSLLAMQPSNRPSPLTRYIVLKHILHCNLEHQHLYFRILNAIYVYKLLNTLKAKRSYIKHKFRLIFMKIRMR